MFSLRFVTGGTVEEWVTVRYRSPLGSSRRAGRAVSLEGLREEERRRKDKSLLDVKLLGLCHTSASSAPLS